ncbi:MAG TPA: ATP-binding protein [Vicinamibacteria bacterium]
MPVGAASRGVAETGGPLAATIDALPVGLYVVDRRLRVVLWNRARERGALGQPRERALGRHLREVLTPEGFRATAPLLRRVFASGRPHEETRETVGARLYHVRRLPVREGRRVTHVLSWFEDVTDRRALEMRVIATDRLTFMGQLVVGVAHEIANPLAGIAGAAQALFSLAAREGRPEAREFRDLLQGEVARCERLVRSLLDAARPSTVPTTVVPEAVGTVLRLLERHPAFGRVKVVCRMARDLPRARIEPDALKQVVLSLAVNAARAMPAGGTLTLRGASAGGRVVLDVLDTGPGVAPALRSRIFQPYFTTHPEGTGLGLAIARALLRGQGGDLEYRPRARGACFRVRLRPARRG